MKLARRVAVVGVVAGAGVAAGLAGGWAAQPGGSMAVQRPYHDGTVWDIGYVRVKPGMEEAYFAYLAGPWKAQHEALKKEGIILSYKVISCEDHGPSDFNLMLMTEYKDLTTMEANEDKADALMQKVAGNDEQQMKGYKDRAEVREIFGNRLSREVVLEPKAGK